MPFKHWLVLILVVCFVRINHKWQGQLSTIIVTELRTDGFKVFSFELLQVVVGYRLEVGVIASYSWVAFGK